MFSERHIKPPYLRPKYSIDYVGFKYSYFDKQIGLLRGDVDDIIDYFSAINGGSPKGKCAF